MTGRDSYAILADRYDAVMAHVDYPSWALLVEHVWKEIGHAPRRILETGAGTCRLTPYLAKRGRRIVSTDLSFPMLARGFSRTSRRACCDFRRLPFRDASFDSLLCLYDAVNYCMERADLDAFFSEAARVLAPGGILFFDATTSRNSSTHFSDVVFHERISEADVVRHSWYDAAARVQHNDFTYFLPRGDGSFSRHIESHEQRVWPRRTFSAAASKAGLRMVGCWDDDLAAAGPDALRLHMACTRPGPVRRVS